VPLIARDFDSLETLAGRKPTNSTSLQGGGVHVNTSPGAVAICVGIDFSAISSVTRLPHQAARSMI
jgi:hypothetical protein